MSCWEIEKCGVSNMIISGVIKVLRQSGVVKSS